MRSAIDFIYKFRPVRINSNDNKPNELPAFEYSLHQFNNVHENGAMSNGCSSAFSTLPDFK